MVFACKKGDREYEKNIYLLRTQSTKLSHLVFFWNLILTHPPTTSQVEVNLNHSFFNILGTHAERKHESWHLGWQREEYGGGRQKGMRKAHINEDNHRQVMPNDRYDVRSRDCHATDAHTS